MDALAYAIGSVAVLGVIGLTIWWYRRARGLTAIGAGLFATIAAGLYVVGSATHDENMLWGAVLSLLSAALCTQLRSARAMASDLNGDGDDTDEP